MTNNSVATQVLIGIGEFAESESYDSKKNKSSVPEKNNTINGEDNNIKANAQYSKSPKTGDNFVSIVVIMGVALSMVTIFIVLRGKRN